MASGNSFSQTEAVAFIFTISLTVQTIAEERPKRCCF